MARIPEAAVEAALDAVDAAKPEETGEDVMSQAIAAALNVFASDPAVTERGAQVLANWDRARYVRIRDRSRSVEVLRACLGIEEEAGTDG